MNRPALILLVIVALLLLAYSVRSYLAIRSAENDLDYLRRQVDQLSGKVTEQEGALAYYHSPEFIYQEAVENLGFTRPGEVIVDLPDLKASGIAIEENEALGSSPNLTTPAPLPYWKRWRALFLGN